MLDELLKSYRWAIHFFVNRGFWKFLFIPFALGFLLMALMVTIVIMTAPWLTQQTAQWFGLNMALWWISLPLNLAVYISLISISFFLFKYVLLVLLFPLMSYVSERVELVMYKGQNNADKNRTIGSVLRDLWRGMVISFHLLSGELFWVLLFSVLALLPLVGLIFGILILVVQSYYAGAGLMDYTLERYKNVSESLLFIRKHKLVASAHGFIFIMLFSLPVLGIIVSPVLATIATTYHTLNILKQHAVQSQDHSFS